MLSALIYIVRIIMFGLAIGTVFIQHKLFPKLNKEQTIIIGVATAPLFISSVDYLLGLIFIGWSSLFYFLIPIMASLCIFLYKKNYLLTKETCRSILYKIVCSIKKTGAWIVYDCIASACLISILLLLFYAKSPKNMLTDYFSSLGIAGVIISVIIGFVIIFFAVFFTIKIIRHGRIIRNLYVIALLVILCILCIHPFLTLEKPLLYTDISHYELDARYFLEDKNSWEVDNYTGEKYGSSLPDDHGPLWIMYLADAKIVADVLGKEEYLLCTNVSLSWVFLCLNIFIFLMASYGGGKKQTGIIALLLFHIYFYSFNPVFAGSRDAFRFVGLLLLMIYVLNQIDRISKGKTKVYEYGILALFCILSMNGHEGNVYIMLGMFFVLAIILLGQKTPLKHLILCGSSVLIGTLIGIKKTIQIYLSTGELSSSTLLPFNNTPVVEQINEVNQKRASKATIWASYTYSVRLVIILGIIGLIVMLIMSLKYKKRDLLWYSLIMLGMLLPMTGIMDWMGYEVSLWFAEQYRYRMYFLMLFSFTGAWLLTRETQVKSVFIICLILCIGGFISFFSTEMDRWSTYTKAQMDISIEKEASYRKIAKIVESVTSKDVFIQDQVLANYLHNNPKLLFHPYSEKLIQAKSDEEIKRAIDELNIGAILLPENGLAYHDYSLLPFWNYINNTEEFSCISQKEGGYSLEEVIFYKNENTTVE